MLSSGIAMRTTFTIRRINALLNRHTLFGAVWIVCGLVSKAQIPETPPQCPVQFVTKAWSTSDGLPHMSVTALAQTRDGYIWVGTLAGLARFDGVSFKVFTPQNCPELPKSRIGGALLLRERMAHFLLPPSEAVV